LWTNTTDLIYRNTSMDYQSNLWFGGECLPTHASTRKNDMELALDSCAMVPGRSNRGPLSWVRVDGSSIERYNYRKMRNLRLADFRFGFSSVASASAGRVDANGDSSWRKEASSDTVSSESRALAAFTASSNEFGAPRSLCS